MKHFLPRLLEVVSTDLELLEGPGTFGLFKYKLRGSLHTGERGSITRQANKWPSAESQSLASWANAMLDVHLHETRNVEQLIEAVSELGMSSEAIIQIWADVAPEFRLQQVGDGWWPTYSDDQDVLATIGEIEAWLRHDGGLPEIP